MTSYERCMAPRDSRSRATKCLSPPLALCTVTGPLGPLRACAVLTAESASEGAVQLPPSYGVFHTDLWPYPPKSCSVQATLKGGEKSIICLNNTICFGNPIRHPTMGQSMVCG